MILDAEESDSGLALVDGLDISVDQFLCPVLMGRGLLLRCFVGGGSASWWADAGAFAHYLDASRLLLDLLDVLAEVLLELSGGFLG